MKMDDKTQSDRAARKKKPSAQTTRQVEALQTKVLETEDRFQIIFDNSPDGMVIINPTENAEGPWLIENCNKAFCEMNGFNRSELIGKDIRVVTNEIAVEVELPNGYNGKINSGSSDGKTNRSEYYQRLKRGPIRIEESHTRKDGSTFYIQSSSCLITLNGQERVLGIDREITERKRVEQALRDSEERYQSLFEDSPTALWLEDFSEVKQKINHLHKSRVKNLRNYFAQHPDSVAQWAALVKIVDVNQAALDLHQTGSKAELLNGLNTIFMNEGLSIFIEEIIALSEGKLSFEGEFIEQTLKGNRINVAVKLSVPPGCQETWAKVIVSTIDITERKRAVEALQQSESSLQAVLHSTADGILAVGNENEVLYTNERFANMWRIPQVVIASKDDNILLRYILDQLIDPQRFLKKVERLYKAKKESFDTLYFKDGRVFDRLSRPLMLGAVVRGRVWSFRDITERKRLEEEIRSLSLTDELTGLYNRRGFTLLAEQEVKRAYRKDRSMLLFFGDVDELKTINDTLGHDQGDLALKEISAILKKCFREADILARFGGDEFVVLALDASKESAEILTDRIQAALEAHNQQVDETFHLSISLGIARYDPEAPSTVSELIAQADSLMYQQKQAKKGKN